MVKFYNPFRPHLCQNGYGRYSIRKLTILGWLYFNGYMYSVTHTCLWGVGSVYDTAKDAWDDFHMAVDRLERKTQSIKKWERDSRWRKV